MDMKDTAKKVKEEAIREEIDEEVLEDVTGGKIQPVKHDTLESKIDSLFYQINGN